MIHNSPGEESWAKPSLQIINIGQYRQSQHQRGNKLNFFLRPVAPAPPCHLPGMYLFTPPSISVHNRTGSGSQPHYHARSISRNKVYCGCASCAAGRDLPSPATRHSATVFCTAKRCGAKAARMQSEAEGPEGARVSSAIIAACSISQPLRCSRAPRRCPRGTAPCTCRARHLLLILQHRLQRCHAAASEAGVMRGSGEEARHAPSDSMPALTLLRGCRDLSAARAGGGSGSPCIRIRNWAKLKLDH